MLGAFDSCKTLLGLPGCHNAAALCSSLHCRTTLMSYLGNATSKGSSQCTFLWNIMHRFANKP